MSASQRGSDGLLPSHPFISPEARDRYLARYDAVATAWPLESERTMVATAEGQTCVWVTGPDDGPPLVLLPGAWAHGLMWPPALIEALSRHYRVLAVDNIADVGRSVSARHLKSADDFTTWLDGLLDGLGLTTDVNIVGISRGGWIAGEYLLRSPERLGKVVLLSPGLVVIGSSLKSLPGAPYSVASLIAPSAWSVRGLLQHLMPYYAAAEPMAFEQYITDTTLALQSFDTRTVCSFLGPRAFTDDELGGIRVPVLYLAGEDETMSSARKAAARLQAVAPSFESKVFPAAGHDLVDVRTADVANAILAFLDA